MRNIRIIIMVLIFAVLTMSLASAAEVTYTGRATVVNSDLRSAQKNSLHNALIGGVRYYINRHLPNRTSEVTNDYLIFIDSYVILKRELVGNTVETTAHITIDDLINEEAVTYMAGYKNSAVFFVKGLPSYVKTTNLRRSLAYVFDTYQFSTNNQVAFEQEIIDTNSTDDVLTAFQELSSQYLFYFQVDLLNYTAGESCTLISDVSYVPSTDLEKMIPLSKMEITAENSDPEKCILIAIDKSAETVLQLVRDKLMPIPDTKVELQQVTLQIENISGLKTINDIMDSLQKRKLIIKRDMVEFAGDKATFKVDCYFTPKGLAEKIASQHLQTIDEVIMYRNDVILKMKHE